MTGRLIRSRHAARFSRSALDRLSIEAMRLRLRRPVRRREGGPSTVRAVVSRVSDEQQIANLIYRYAELVDAGRFEEVAALFAHATYASLPGSEIAGFMRAMVTTYHDGTPKTAHITTNVRVELDEGGSEASSTSAFTVYQAAPNLALQVIVIGRYRDRFERIDTGWRFTERSIQMDLVGDMSKHLRRPPRPSHLTDTEEPRVIEESAE